MAGRFARSFIGCALLPVIGLSLASAQGLPEGTTSISPLARAQTSGPQRLTMWGFDIYDASLWIEPGFRRSAYAQHRFALELTYLRPFSAADIATRSIAEMRRAGELSEEQARRWRAALLAVLPDVNRGDRLTGIHVPGLGARFLFNGRTVGDVADPRFSERFFGIWLGSATSQPALRDALLTGTPP